MCIGLVNRKASIATYSHHKGSTDFKHCIRSLFARKFEHHPRLYILSTLDCNP